MCRGAWGPVREPEQIPAGIDKAWKKLTESHRNKWACSTSLGWPSGACHYGCMTTCPFPLGCNIQQRNSHYSTHKY